MSETPLASESTPPAPDASVTDQFSAVINIHGSTLNQVEAALVANQHTQDPHPADPTKRVNRHPVYIVAEDYSTLDDQGRPSPGAPAELDLTTVRQIMSARSDWISPDGPPADGSHVRVAGMHTIAELDSAGQPTGRVTLGDAS